MGGSRRPRRGGLRSNSPPEGESWIWLTREMLGSEAHRSLGINARRVLDCLLHEHCAHGGRENGRLLAPYNQLERIWHVPRSEIRAAIEQLQGYGWIDVRGGDRLGGRSNPSRYALTWLPILSLDGSIEHLASNRWKRVDRPAVERFTAERDRQQTFMERRKQARKEKEAARSVAPGAEILEAVREVALDKVREVAPAEAASSAETRTGAVREVGAVSDFRPGE